MKKISLPIEVTQSIFCVEIENECYGYKFTKREFMCLMRLIEKVVGKGIDVENHGELILSKDFFKECYKKETFGYVIKWFEELVDLKVLVNVLNSNWRNKIKKIDIIQSYEEMYKGRDDNSIKVIFSRRFLSLFRKKRNKQFVSIDLDLLEKMNLKSIFLYILLKGVIKYREIHLQYEILNKFLGVHNDEMPYFEFNKRYLKKAIEEINLYSDLNVEYRKIGKKEIKNKKNKNLIKFIIEEKNSLKNVK